MNKKSPSYFIVTFGCQANKLDSERIAGLMKSKGYKLAKDKNSADLLIINSCSVRQSAEDRVIGLIKNINNYKIQKTGFKSSQKFGRKNKINSKNLKLIKPRIILTGCMVGSATGEIKRYHLSELQEKMPYVYRFIPIKNLLGNFKGRAVRKKTKSAFVSIMEGCNNFCTYCVVPYSRGKEISRPLEEIVCEVENLIKNGYQEITLLGQNVNSYHKNIKFKLKNPKLKIKIKGLEKKYRNNFAILLNILNDIKGLKKISFITSNPQDLDNDIIQAIKLPKVDKNLHLPIQSGDNEVLRKMNRKYTAEQYCALIKKLRTEIPEIKISTDIIVGFPGENKKQFENTVRVCRKIKFCKAYIAKYSPREGTTAYKFKDDVSPMEKKRRWQILNKLINC